MKRKAAAILAGTAGEGKEVVVVEAGKTPCKKATSIMRGMEPIAVSGTHRKSALDDINVALILWGHSQKIQIAGV